MSGRHKRAVTLLVGAGRMGSALLKGWVARGIEPIAAVEPVPHADLRRFARRHRILLRNRIEETGGLCVAACVVALKPQILQTEAPRLRPIAQSGALMISIAAGTGIASLRKAWGRNACIVRAMPNTPGSIGQGISALFAPRNAPARARAHAQSLLAGLGETCWVTREELIDAVTAVSGSGPAYAFLMAESLGRAARAEGLPRRVADRLARATISGAGALLDADPREPADLRRDVTSPGGTTEAALKVLMENDALGKLIAEAVSAARGRAVELRRQTEP
ncbi:MAG: pyrroline-5-carboxylate reductase [Rhizomicrobium sp.]